MLLWLLLTCLCVPQVLDAAVPKAGCQLVLQLPLDMFETDIDGDTDSETTSASFSSDGIGDTDSETSSGGDSSSSDGASDTDSGTSSDGGSPSSGGVSDADSETGSDSSSSESDSPATPSTGQPTVAAVVPVTATHSESE